MLILVFSIGGMTTVSALELGDNITVFDNVTGTSLIPIYNMWWSPTDEDQEVEPDCAIGQEWDVEAFFLNGTELAMVGGYDFKNGLNDIFFRRHLS
jgi:hypothetical protein